MTAPDTTPELLSPAGNWDCARAAVAAGADAVYFGLPKFNARLRADVLRIFNKPGVARPGVPAAGCGDLDRMEAEGSVYYVTPDRKVRANAAVYVAGSTTITMTGDVVAVQGQNVLRGDRMVFNTETGEGQMQGGGKGGKNRPRGVFYPNQTNTTSSPRK